MDHISIEVTAAEHRQLEAMAARQQKSVKDLVLDRTIRAAADQSENESLVELETVLIERIRVAEENGSSNRTAEDVFEDAFRKLEAKADA